MLKKGLVISILFLILTSGCSKKLDYDYATDEPFIVVSSSIAGPDIARNFYPTNISLYDNGKLVLHTESTKDIFIGEDAPVVELEVEKSEVDSIKRLMKKNGLWELGDVSDNDSVDGSFLYITVNLIDESKTVGGLNPNNDSFNEIFDSVSDLVDSEDYRLWHEEINDYIIEKNPELE